MKKMHLEKTVNSIAYVIWALSLWMLSYFQALEYNFEIFKEEYLKAIWCLIFAGIFLYGNSKQELRHEMFKSIVILMGSTLLDIMYNQNNDIRKIVIQLVVLIVYQCLAYIIILMLESSKKLHGKKAKKLAIIFMLVIGGLHFIFGCNYLVSVICAGIIDLIVGARYHLEYIKVNDNIYLKVKYKGDLYSVNILDKIKIEEIKLLLLAKRIKRRIFLIIPENLILYLILTLCWIFWGLISYHIGIKFKSPEPYMVKDVIWELKNSYFSSVVLALLISGYSQISGYKKRIEIQHDFYTDVISKFDNLFKTFIGSEVYHYMPFYNYICLKDTLEYIEKCEEKDCKFSIIEFITNLEEIFEQLEKIEYERRHNSIVGMNKQSLDYHIQQGKDFIRKELKACETFEQAKEIVQNLSNSLFYIISDIRRPWRWDIENDKKILEILANYEENNIKEDFYYKMHLYGHKFKI